VIEKREFDQMEWTRTYPTLETAMEASFETLCSWADNLPAAQTDVERCVLRRIKARKEELARETIRKERPDIAAKFNEIIDTLERFGIKSPVGRY